MKYIFILILFLAPSELAAQTVPREAKRELDAYKKEIKRLNELYLQAIIKARTDVDLELSRLAKKYSDAGNVEFARRVEAEKGNLNLSNSIEKRLDLQLEITGELFKFDKQHAVYQFDSDGYIYIPVKDHEHKKYPWVTVSESEVLYMNELGDLGLLQFFDGKKKGFD